MWNMHNNNTLNTSKHPLPHLASKSWSSRPSYTTVNDSVKLETVLETRQM